MSSSKDDPVAVEALGQGAFLVRGNKTMRFVHYVISGEEQFIHFDGVTYRLSASSAEHEALVAGPADVSAPMPGQITQVFVAVGDTVAAGTPLYSLEAMKMEHLVRAAGDSTVVRLLAAAGSQVERGDTVVELSEASAKAER